MHSNAMLMLPLPACQHCYRNELGAVFNVKGNPSVLNDKVSFLVMIGAMMSSVTPEGAQSEKITLKMS